MYISALLFIDFLIKKRRNSEKMVFNYHRHPWIPIDRDGQKHINVNKQVCVFCSLDFANFRC